MKSSGARALIEAGLRFSPSYRGYLANHMPMAVMALEALGASDEAIARFADRYEPRLELLAPGPIADEIRRLAIERGDEHDIKLAYSFWREGRFYGRDLYRRVASRTVSRHAPGALTSPD